MAATSPRAGGQAAGTEQRGPGLLQQQVPPQNSSKTRPHAESEASHSCHPCLRPSPAVQRGCGSWFAEHRDARWPCSDQKISLTLKSLWNLDRQHWGRGSKPWREDWKLLLTPGKPRVCAVERLEAVWGAVWGMIPLHCSKCRVQPYCTLSIRVSNAGLSFGDICQFGKRHPRG